MPLPSCPQQLIDRGSQGHPGALVRVVPTATRPTTRPVPEIRIDMDKAVDLALPEIKEDLSLEECIKIRTSEYDRSCREVSSSGRACSQAVALVPQNTSPSPASATICNARCKRHFDGITSRPPSESTWLRMVLRKPI